MNIHGCFHNWDGVHAWMDCLSNAASTTLWGPRSCSGCHPGAGLRHWHCNPRGTHHRRNMRSIYVSSFILRKWIWVAKDFFPSIVIYQVRLPNIYFSPAVWVLSYFSCEICARFHFWGKILTWSGLFMYSVCALITSCSKRSGSILLSLYIILDMEDSYYYLWSICVALRGPSIYWLCSVLWSCHPWMVSLW